MADGDVHSEDFWLMTGHHSVPEVVINRDGPEERVEGTTKAAGPAPSALTAKP
jgi:hypothetical protein